MAMMSSDYLFEVLTEEIPAWMLRSRLQTLRARLTELVTEFAGEEAEPGEVTVDATSRRICVQLHDLPRRQQDRDEEVKGPPESVAFGDDGAATRALQGFLRKNGAEESQIERRDSYVWLRRTVSGLSAAEFLAARIPPLIEELRWPKMMRFDGHAWIRPIHSLISLLDGEVIPLEIFGVPAGRETMGHRTRSSGRLEIASGAEYVQTLRKAQVVLHADERVRIMRETAEALASEVGGAPAEDASIWEQWRYLTESPGVVRAEFSEEFLVLPAEVLITVMRVHQKQLPIYAGEKLTRYFLAAMDGDSDPDGFASTGNAFVTNARFADALFFYQTDRRRKLVERVNQLSHLQFQEKLGDYLRKTHRIAAIAELIRTESGSAASREDVHSAAEIAKVDLLTEMVKEFTDLQGQIGGIYAREEGYPEVVWQAVYDHYTPVSVEDALPRNEVGAILSLADRIDTVVGFFQIGLQPSGSKDPFALRRAAQGVVQILLNREPWRIDISIGAMVDMAIAEYNVPENRRDDLRRELMEFFSERVRSVLEGPLGFAYDEVAAAMAAGWSSGLPDLRDRIAALREGRSSREFLSILDSARRIANITPEGFSGTVAENLLEHDTEKRLAELSTVVNAQIDELIQRRAYGSALESFAGMASELETFFNDVMVMVDDPAVRDNRLALLNRVGNAVGKIADVTKIVVDRSDYS